MSLTLLRHATTFATPHAATIAMRLLRWMLRCSLLFASYHFARSALPPLMLFDALMLLPPMLMRHYIFMPALFLLYFAMPLRPLATALIAAPP